MASSTTVGAGAGASDDGSAGVRHRGGGASAAGVGSQRDLLTESRQANAQSHLRRPTCLQRVRFFIAAVRIFLAISWHKLWNCCCGKRKAADGNTKGRATRSNVAKLPCDVLLLGINGAGKTALLNILQLHSHAADKLGSEALPAAEPTTGFFMRTIVAPMTKLTFREVGGAAVMRPYWHKYACDSLVYVIDLSQPDKLAESLEALRSFVEQVYASRASDDHAIVVVGNRAGAQGALPCRDLATVVNASGISSSPIPVVAMPVVPSASASKDIEQAVATIDEAIVRAYLVRHPEAAA